MRAIESKDGMQRISTVLKTSEAMAVRKAVCMAGAECVVIIPTPFCATDMENCCFEQPAARSEAHVRLDVMANDIHHGGIVSAIRRVVQDGRVDLAFYLDDSHMRTA
jgi:hypothetical protein